MLTHYWLENQSTTLKGEENLTFAKLKKTLNIFLTGWRKTALKLFPFGSVSIDVKKTVYRNNFQKLNGNIISL